MLGHGAQGHHWDQVGGPCLGLTRVLSPCPTAGLGGGPCLSGLELGGPQPGNVALATSDHPERQRAGPPQRPTPSQELRGIECANKPSLQDHGATHVKKARASKASQSSPSASFSKVSSWLFCSANERWLTCRCRWRSRIHLPQAVQIFSIAMLHLRLPLPPSWIPLDPRPPSMLHAPSFAFSETAFKFPPIRPVQSTGLGILETEKVERRIQPPVDAFSPMHDGLESTGVLNELQMVWAGQGLRTGAALVPPPSRPTTSATMNTPSHPHHGPCSQRVCSSLRVGAKTCGPGDGKPSAAMDACRSCCSHRSHHH
jgi:hypothetical protein